MATASPLAAALVGGNEPALLDPATVQANADVQLGQSMQQQGLSTAPAYLPQALGRLAQALSGTYVQHQGISQLGKAMSGTIEGLKNIFHEDTAIGQGLRSDKPLVQAMAATAAQKSFVFSGQYENLAPGHLSRMAGGGAGGNANTNPRDEVAIGAQAAAQARADGNEPLAQEIETEISRRLYTDRGLKPPPTPTAPPQQRVPQAPPRVVPTPVGSTPPIQPRPPGVPPPAAGAGAVPLAQPPRIAPPAPGNVPPPTTNQQSLDQIDRTNAPALAQAKKGMTYEQQIIANKGATEATEKLFGGASEALGKSIGEQIEAGGKNARDRMNALNTIENALTAGGKGVATGPFAERALKAKEALDAFGIDTSWVKNGLPESEVISKMNAQLAAASSKAMTGRPTQFEFASWMKNNPGLLNSKEGTLALTHILKQATQQDIDIGKLAQNKSNWEHWADTTDKYYKEHPLISPFTNKPMGQEAAAPVAAGSAPASTAGWTVRRVQPKTQQ